jgi:uncharacterized protein
MIIQDLREKGLIKPPEWLDTNVCYLTIMGSMAYGVSNDDSDEDIYGFAIPTKEILFPHYNGCFFVPPSKKEKAFTLAFGDETEVFAQWEKHGVVDQSANAGKGKEYDFAIFNIIKYFQLLYDNNPNIIDSIFTPQECVKHMTQVGNLVRENREVFLHKGCFKKFKGYAYSQLHKMRTKKTKGKRQKIREEFGYDVKFGYNLVRLLNECEQLLMTGTLDLRHNNEQLKAIRRGEMGEKEVMAWASDKEKHLESLFVKSELPTKPRKAKIKKILMECLSCHYDNLDNCVVEPDKYKKTLQEVKLLINKAGV